MALAWITGSRAQSDEVDDVHADWNTSPFHHPRHSQYGIRANAVSSVEGGGAPPPQPIPAVEQRGTAAELGRAGGGAPT